MNRKEKGEAWNFSLSLIFLREEELDGSQVRKGRSTGPASSSLLSIKFHPKIGIQCLAEDLLVASEAAIAPGCPSHCLVAFLAVCMVHFHVSPPCGLCNCLSHGHSQQYLSLCWILCPHLLFLHSCHADFLYWTTVATLHAAYGLSLPTGYRLSRSQSPWVCWLPQHLLTFIYASAAAATTSAHPDSQLHSRHCCGQMEKSAYLVRDLGILMERIMLYLKKSFLC